jgi:putative ABC transport system permease protein
MPEWKAEIRVRLAHLHLTPTREAAIVEELAQDLDDCYAALVASGESEAKAYQQTLAELGNHEWLTSEWRRVERPHRLEPLLPGTNRRATMIADLWQDLRFGARLLRKQPSFTLLAVLTLALGIGASTAIFSFVNAILLRPLPLPQPEQLVTLSERNWEKGQSLKTASPRNLEDWERQSQTIAAFGAWRDWRFTLQESDGPTLVRSAIATPGLFRVLRVNFALGRAFLDEENQPGRDQVVVLSYAFWQKRFGGDPQIIGQTLSLDKKSFTIVGVLPRELESLWLGEYNLWAPVSVDPDQRTERHLRNRRVYARLKPGVTLPAAQTEMDNIAQQLAAAYPAANAGWGVALARLQDTETGDVRRVLWIFFGAVGLVLLIACANVANLTLARGATRHKEFAVRAVLGARLGQLLRQLCVESVLLAALGGVLGWLIAHGFVNLFAAFSPTLTPRGVTLDNAVLGFTFLLSLLTGVLFGLAPGWQAMRINLVAALNDGTRGSAARLNLRWRGALVVSQVALALALLVGAGLLGQSLVRALTMPPGYNPEGLLTLQLFLPTDKYTERTQVADFYRRIAAEFKTIPGVTGVGAISAGPQFGGHESVEFLPTGQLESSNGSPQARYYDAGPDYFRTMQIPLLAGREFNDRDHANAPPVAIVNQTLAQHYWPGESAVGKRLTLVREKKELEIVGVAGDVRAFGLQQQSEPEIYWPNLQHPRWASFFVIRAASNPASLVTALRQRVWQTDAEVQVVGVSTMDNRIASALKPPRFNLLLLSLFAGTSLLLAIVGLYAVVSHLTVRRTHEIGIRMALGASRLSVLQLVLTQGMKLTLAGLGLGLSAALGLTRWLKSLLFGITATDPLTFTTMALLLLFVALLACWIPARRATKVDPLIALRSE